MLPKTTGIPMAPNYVYKITKKDLHERYSRTGQALILGISLDTQDNRYVVTGNRSGV